MKNKILTTRSALSFPKAITATIGLSACIFLSNTGFAQAKPGALPKVSEEGLKALKDLGSSEKEFHAAYEKALKDKAAFAALPEDSKTSWAGFIQKAITLNKEKRVAESLFQVLEAKKIFSKDIVIYNLLGSNYVELRDFKNAINAFKSAVELQPYNASLHFNLAESYFISNDYTESLKIFQHVQKLNKLNKSVSGFDDIITFKIDLCHLGIANAEGTTEADKAKHLETFNKAVDARKIKDHNLLTYYSKAAQAYSKDDQALAQRWLRDARFVFNKQAAHLPWLDTMLEFGYISKIYKTAEEVLEAWDNLSYIV